MNEERVRAEEADAEAWDKQIEDDAKSGRLDDFMAKARAEIKAGRVRPIP